MPKWLKIIPNILGARAQARFSTTLFLKLICPEKTNLFYFERCIFFQKQTYFASKNVGVTHKQGTKKAGKMPKFYQ